MSTLISVPLTERIVGMILILPLLNKRSGLTLIKYLLVTFRLSAPLCVSDPPVHEKNLLREFKRLDIYLNSPLPEEIDLNSRETITVSKRKFLDGDRLTLADCNLLPKLHVIRVRQAFTLHLRSFLVLFSFFEVLGI